ncbi:hypothetical protein MMPV_009015 [Pyropia vietnamensis]
MLHKVKKSVATMSPHVVDNAEVQEYKHRLDGATKALTYGLQVMAATEKNWTTLVGSNFVGFSDRFATLYPDDDPLRAVAKNTATSSMQLMKAFTARTEATGSDPRKMEEKVKAYLAEIEEVDREVKTSLQSAKIELDMYAKKMSSLQAKTGSHRDESKIGRNLEKYDTARQEYENSVAAVVVKQKAVWDKRQLAFSALFVAYFTQQSTAVAHCASVLSGTFAFADANRENLVSLNMATASGAVPLVVPPGCNAEKPVPMVAADADAEDGAKLADGTAVASPAATSPSA